jgi:hypothetical protein
MIEDDGEVAADIAYIFRIADSLFGRYALGGE